VVKEIVYSEEKEFYLYQIVMKSAIINWQCGTI